MTVINVFRDHTPRFTESLPPPPRAGLLRSSLLKTKRTFFLSSPEVWFVCLFGGGERTWFFWRAGSGVLRGYKNGNDFYWQSPGIELRQMES